MTQKPASWLLRTWQWLTGQQEIMRLAALVATAAFLADWASKSWALDALKHASASLGSLVLELETNHAFAFSDGAASVSPQTVIGVRLIALLVIAVVFGRILMRDRRSAAGTGLILGGGFGNATDVAFRGGVVDFIGAGPLTLDYAGDPIQLHFFFNTADLAILLGIGLMAPMINLYALAAQRRLGEWETRWSRDRRLFL
ncbi:MAG: signal peptidase II [Gemmatimonadota bacterium]